MWWIFVKFVPWLLTDKQKHRQYVSAKTWLWPPTLLDVWFGSLWFLLFWGIKLQLQGCCFQNVPEIQDESPTTPHVIPKC